MNNLDTHALIPMEKYNSEEALVQLAKIDQLQDQIYNKIAPMMKGKTVNQELINDITEVVREMLPEPKYKINVEGFDNDSMSVTFSLNYEL